MDIKETPKLKQNYRIEIMVNGDTIKKVIKSENISSGNSVTMEKFKGD